MAEPAAQSAPRLVAATPRRTVPIPEDLLALLTEDRARKINARVAAKLKGLPEGGVVTIRLIAGPGGTVIDSHVISEEHTS